MDGVLRIEVGCVSCLNGKEDGVLLCTTTTMREKTRKVRPEIINGRGICGALTSPRCVPLLCVCVCKVKRFSRFMSGCKHISNKKLLLSHP